jgi:isopenicillin-N epimerase
MSDAPHAWHWALDPSVTYLNHGSFGACPLEVLAVQQEWRARLEREPVRFLLAELPALLAEVRGELGSLVGADPDDLAFVANATTGVNTVLASYPLRPGDAVLVTDHGYPACRNAAAYWAGRAGAAVQVAELPFPIEGSGTVVERVLGAVTPRTRIAVLDHVTSPSGLVFPIAQLVEELASRGIETLVDGAHAPGMFPLDLRSLGASYYTGNLHKWCCAPKAAAFLWVARARQRHVRPLVISHGASAELSGVSRFRAEFDWMGAWDPTVVLALPAALALLRGLYAGGWSELFQQNRALALEARRILCRALGSEPACPDEMIGSLAAVLFPPETPRRPTATELYAALTVRGFEVPIFPWPQLPSGFVRVSAQAYNDRAQYEALGVALREELGLS